MGHAVVGGWRYLWTDGGVGAIRACGSRMLAGVSAVSVVLVRALSVSCLVDGVQARGGGSVSGGMLQVGFSRLVEQEFEEVALVYRGQGGCMLQVFVVG